MFEFSERSRELQALLTQFMQEHVYPNESVYAEQLHQAPDRFSYLPLMDELKAAPVACLAEDQHSPAGTQKLHD